MFRKLALVVSLSVLAIGTAASARADTTYTYTGNALTDCTGTYFCHSGSQFLAPPALSITFDVKAGTQLDNLTNKNLNAFVGTIDSFSATDGLGNFVNFGDTEILDILVSTNATGNIISWNVFAETADPPLGTVAPFAKFQTESELASVGDLGFLAVAGNFMSTTVAFGFNSNNPGTWTMTSNSTMPTPEPSSSLLLGAGLLGLASLGLRKSH
jgi:hypothetical protein